MAPRFWLCNGKIIATADGKPKLCENDPCVPAGPNLVCCPDGESPGELLTFAWASSEFDGIPGPGGSAQLFYNEISQAYEGLYDDPNIDDTFIVDLGCSGAEDGREFDLGGGGAAAAGGNDTSDSCTTLLLEFGTLAATGVSTLFDVTVSN